MKVLHAMPALPVTDADRSVAFWRDSLGFTARHHLAGAMAIMQRDGVEVQLWACDDQRWRGEHRQRPVVSGAESFIAGTASCRICVDAVDELFAEPRVAAVLPDHPNAQLHDTDFGTREFGLGDPDNNLITFFQRV